LGLKPAGLIRNQQYLIPYYPWAEAGRANKESAGFYFLIYLGLKPAGLIRNQQDFIMMPILNP
jgi:hypothetical protein